MSDAVLTPSGGLFPAGTTVSAYYPWEKMLGRAPFGAAIATAVVSDQGTLTFVGLLEDTSYTAYAQIGLIHRYIDFRTDMPEEAPADVDLSTVYAQIAELTARVNTLETTGTAYPDASTSVKGSTKLTASPAVASEPLAVGDNDSRMGAIAANTSAISALDSRITTAEDDIVDITGQQEMGRHIVGGSQNSMSGSVKYASPFAAPISGVIDTIWVDVSGGGSAGSGTQKLRVQVHDDVAGVATNRLAESTAEGTIVWADGRAWMAVPLSAPLTVLQGQIYWLGFHADANGGVGRYGYTNGVGGTKYSFANDQYSNGSTTTFGTASTVNGQVLSVYTVVTPLDLTTQVETLETDVAALDGRMDSAEADIADLISGGGGGGGIVTQVVDSGTLTASEVSTGPWIDTGATSGGVFIAASSKSSIAGTLTLQDSADGVTPTTRATSATASVSGQHVANILALSGQRYVRVVYENTAGAASGFELVQGYSVTG